MGIRQELGAYFSTNRPFLRAAERQAVKGPQTPADKECMGIRSAAEVLLSSHGKPGQDKDLGGNLSVVETVPVAGKPTEVYIDAWGKDPKKADFIHVHIHGEQPLRLATDHGEVPEAQNSQRRVTENDKEFARRVKDAIEAVGKKLQKE